MERFKFLERIAIADIAFQAYGTTLEDLFASSAEALFTAMADLKTVEAKEEESIAMESDKLEDLIFDWLSELVYLKDARGLLFKSFEVKIEQDGKFKLSAKIMGEKINPEKHGLKVDVKAVTYHMLEVKKTENLWSALVVLDV